MFEAIVSAYRWIFLQFAGIVGLGWGVVLLSVICSALMIPLMRLVAGIVKREADYQAVIMPQLEDIKSRYASDVERHLHIQRLYRRQRSRIASFTSRKDGRVRCLHVAGPSWHPAFCPLAAGLQALFATELPEESLP